MSIGGICRAIFYGIYQVPRCLCSVLGAILVCCGLKQCCGCRLRSSSCVKRFLYWFGIDSSRDFRVSCVVRDVQEHKSLHHKKLHVILKTGDRGLRYQTPQTTSLNFNCSLSNMVVEQGCSAIEVLLCVNKTVIAKGKVLVSDVATILATDSNAPTWVDLRGKNVTTRIQILWMGENSEHVPLLLGVGMGHEALEKYDVNDIAKKCSGFLKKANVLGFSQQRYFKVTRSGGKWVFAWYNVDAGQSRNSPPMKDKYIVLQDIKTVVADVRNPKMFIVRYCQPGRRDHDLVLERSGGPTTEAWVEGLRLMMAHLKKERRPSGNSKDDAHTPNASNRSSQRDSLV